MTSFSRFILTGFLAVFQQSANTAEARPWQIFLLFGQSNMAGTAQPGSEDVFNNPRVKMLAYDNCSSQGRTYNEWYTANGGLHSCSSGFGIGDWFAKVVADSMTQDTLALIPCAIPGVDIDFFRKDVISTRRNEFRIPPDNHWDGAYPWMLERLKKALEKGVIKGILLHQGEADWTAEARKAWPGKVTEIYDDLKTDLSFGDVPFMVGELRPDGQACCGAHNPYVAELAKALPDGHVISATGLGINNDAYHFNTSGMREFGKRFAAAYLAAAPPTANPFRPMQASQKSWSYRPLVSGSVLEFDQVQDQIRVWDSRGRLLAKGDGKFLQIPTDSKRQLLFFHAQAGEYLLTGVLPQWQ